MKKSGTRTDPASSRQKLANPCVLVIFGITGDLTKRLLYPALCNLGSKGLLDEKFCIVGIARGDYTSESFAEKLSKDVRPFVTDPAAKKFSHKLIKRVHYIRGGFTEQKTFIELKTQLQALQAEQASENCLFYFAAPPEMMTAIAAGLHKAGLLTEEEDGYFRRIVVEKPFGRDLDSAKQLDCKLLTFVDENQIFRVDHYLGKETVQNLLAFRFTNGIFEPIWNRRYIDFVQITVAETIGVELRGAFYEQTGALRDMVSSHLLQVLSLITMEPPVSFDGENIQNEKSKALRAIQIYTQDDVLNHAIRGQYGPGKINAEAVAGYRSEQSVDPDSAIETYVALKLLLNNWRWLHVPFYIRTGKRMPVRSSEIIIQFKSGPAILYENYGRNVLPNLLRIKIQPNEGISLRFNAKIPGTTLELGQVDMNFKYSDYFGVAPQTGYENVLFDCMNGDHTLFERAEMVETAWSILQPILDVWGALKPNDFPNYAAGSWGPTAADKLLKRDGRVWIL